MYIFIRTVQSLEKSSGTLFKRKSNSNENSKVDDDSNLNLQSKIRTVNTHRSNVFDLPYKNAKKKKCQNKMKNINL